MTVIITIINIILTLSQNTLTEGYFKYKIDIKQIIAYKNPVR